MGKQVLIVDDASFMRMMIKDILTKNGYEVVGEAENGNKALEKYKEYQGSFGNRLRNSIDWKEGCFLQYAS